MLPASKYNFNPFVIMVFGVIITEEDAILIPKLVTVFNSMV